MCKRTVPVEDHTFTKKTILLVEDNRDDELLTIRALRKAKVLNHIEVARDGEEALNYLKHCEPLPAVVLLDLKLPKISGMDVLRAMRKDPTTRRIPVVILTSSYEITDVEEGYRQGVNSYICKPVHFENFTQAVGELGVYWLLLNEAPVTGFAAPAHGLRSAGV